MVQVTHLRDGTFFGRIFFRKVRAGVPAAGLPSFPYSSDSHHR